MVSFSFSSAGVGNGRTTFGAGAGRLASMATLAADHRDGACEPGGGGAAAKGLVVLAVLLLLLLLLATTTGVFNGETGFFSAAFVGVGDGGRDEVGVAFLLTIGVDGLLVLRVDTVPPFTL
jgi:hypothetical protein